METITRFFDTQSELETDDVLEKLNECMGGYLGYFCPLSWNFKRVNRYLTLAKTFLFSIIYGISLFLIFITLFRSLEFDYAYAVEILIVFIFLFFLLTFNIINLSKRRSFCEMFKYVTQGFMKYSDFPENEEIYIRNVFKKRMVFQRKLWSCVFLVGFFFPIILIFDNKMRDPASLPDWFDFRLPVPVWTPTDSSGPLLFTVLFFFELFLVVTAVSAIFGIGNCMSLVVLAVTCEMKIIIEALRQQHTRAVTTYARFMESSGIPSKEILHDSSRLTGNEIFKAINSDCYKKIIKHHQHIIRFFWCVNDVSSIALVLVHYSSGPFLGLSIAVALDDRKPWSLRLLLLIIALITYIILLYLCSLAQEMTNAISSLHEEVYMSSWINSDKRFKKLMNIFQTKTLKPEFIKSKFGARMDYTFFLLVSQACYSVLNFIIILKKNGFI